MLLETADAGFVARVRALRITRLCAHAGMHRDTVSEWIAGRKGMRRHVYNRLIAAMNDLEPPPPAAVIDLAVDGPLVERIHLLGVARVARKAGLSPHTVSRWISGRRPAAHKTRAAIVAAAASLKPRVPRDPYMHEYNRAYYRRHKTRWPTYAERKASGA